MKFAPPHAACGLLVVPLVQGMRDREAPHDRIDWRYMRDLCDAAQRCPSGWVAPSEFTRGTIGLFNN